VDQPVGTGFSYADSIVDYVTDEDEIAEDMYQFLQQFFKIYPQYANLAFFVTGESYAGHYIPAISHRIMQGNNNKEGLYINLKGLAIGNGWVDPIVQYAGYAAFAYKNNLIGEAAYYAWNATYLACEALIESGLWFLALEECQLMVEGILVQMGVSLGYDPNVYDIRIPCEDPPLCYDFSAQSNFMNSPTVQKALGVNMEWEDCGSLVHTLLLGDWVTNMEEKIPDLLAAGYQVLVYSGVDDYICNYVGGYMWVSEMNWPGQSTFNTAPFVDWNVNGQVAGQSKTASNLVFLQVNNAGHMVPMDQPQNALDMLNRFLTNSPFN